MSDVDELLNIVTAEIESLSVHGVYYEVDLLNETCTCPSFIYYGMVCKHLQKVGIKKPYKLEPLFYVFTSKSKRRYHYDENCPGLKLAKEIYSLDVELIGSMKGCKICTNYT
jgi:hypothetical protein